jgi:hypothetical protein
MIFLLSSYASIAFQYSLYPPCLLHLYDIRWLKCLKNTSILPSNLLSLTSNTFYLFFFFCLLFLSFSTYTIIHYNTHPMHFILVHGSMTILVQFHPTSINQSFHNFSIQLLQLNNTYLYNISDHIWAQPMHLELPWALQKLVVVK